MPKAKETKETKDSKDVEFNQPSKTEEKTKDVEGEPVSPDAEESYEENLASIENNTVEKTFAGPVYTEDPDEPNPIGMVSHICALCYNFPCRDHGVNKRSHQPFHSTALNHSYQVPHCRTKHNFLANFDPIPLIGISKPYSKDASSHEKARQIAEAERDKAEMYVFGVRERLTYIMARIETVTRKFSEDTPQNASALRAAFRDVLKTMHRDIVPDYKFDM